MSKGVTSSVRLMRFAATAALLFLFVSMSTSARAQPFAMTVASSSSPRTAGDEYWQMLKADLAESFGDRLDATYLLYGELGSEENLISSLRRGRIQIAGPSAQSVSTVIPEVALLYAPYLFDSYEEVDYVIDNHLEQILAPLFEEKGMTLLGWTEVGFHQVYGKKPIVVPADVEGVRFRSSMAQSAQLFAASIGGDVIPMGFADLVTSLQTNMVAAGENAVIIYARYGIAEEATHLTLTQHAYGVSIVVGRTKWLEALPAEDRSTLLAALPDVATARQLVRDEEQELIAEGAESGFTVHRLTPEQREAWRDATATSHVALIDAIGGRAQEIYDAIIVAREEYRTLQASGN